jgi:hypothetical protein
MPEQSASQPWAEWSWRFAQPAKLQLRGQSHTLDFQRFTLRKAVKIMTFAGGWQNLDGLVY